ncbi:hypothetical protein EDB85DRAFT_2145105 [Lactarius pseudohatsudake]|nr:hypothetical protein EDB85DRAFT_2145105 [Lactarius pseudohatsudake]
MEVGQWVRCIAGRYRDDVGYLYESDISIQGDVVVIFVPRIPQSGGKRKRDGRPAPQVWTIAELAQQYGQRKVKVLGPNKFVFRGSVYEDGLVMEHIPSSYLRVLDILLRTLRRDNVKNRWTDSFGMVVAIDNVEQKVTFLDREANAEHPVFSSPLRFFRFTPGLYVEFPGKGGATHRGRILQVPDGSIAQVIDEVSGQHTDITVSGVQAAALHRSEHRRIWEGKRVMITKGSLKGYHGLVKAEDPNGVDVELDAKIASHGLAKQHFQYGEFQVEPISMPVVASLSRLNRTPPPEDVPRAITPEPEEPEEKHIMLSGLPSRTQ